MKNRKSLFILITILILLTLQGCYLSDQAAGQFDLIWNQVPIPSYLKAEVNLEQRQLLSLVPEVKQYGETVLSLKETENYDGYFKTRQEGITFVVTASHRFRLEPYTWWFPIIGSVPYKGYFDKKNAIELKEQLERDGYDTWLFAAPAYSTLGWFKDPVTTPMLRAGAFSLVETILHEMSHTTLYVDDQGDFNEQLASFVGNLGAEQFFRQKGILSVKQLRDVKEKKRRAASFNQRVLSFIPRFQSVYEQETSIDQIQKKKTALFEELINNISEIYPKVPRENWQFNNARLLQFRRYRSNAELFEEFWLKSGQDWKTFWSLVRKYIKNKDWD
ncbi:MAG: aminopeptidase [Proteobacteria bacterium]|nr:aminopeptidase [Pseudomonadota bacterium]